MTLATDLINILDNKEEPLPKRLKIADNAFKSPEILIPQRESLLLKWLIKISKANNIKTWTQCQDWLASERFKELNRSDISLGDCFLLIDEIAKRLKKTEDELITNQIITTVNLLISNRVFQHHLTSDIKHYCEFISSTIGSIKTEQLLLKFIQNDQLFNKTLIIQENFYKYFMEIIFSSLAQTASIFEGNYLVFEELSKIVQKCVFFKNLKHFVKHFKEDEEDSSKLPQYIFKKLKESYISENAYNSYKLIFHALCKTTNDFSLIYNTFILLSSSVGFKIDTFPSIPLKVVKDGITVEKTTLILSGLFEILSVNKNDLNLKINEVSFTQFVENIIKSIMNISKVPDKNCYNIFHFTILINPLIIETFITPLFMYISLSKNVVYKEKLLTSIFEVFAKLHRIQNLISKIIPAFKKALDGDDLDLKNSYEFQGDINTIAKIEEFNVENILSKNVLEYFTHCITLLASWQVMNLYKTLLFHLSSALESDVQDPKKIIYFELICALLCQFLQSVRIAEHTVSTQIVEKFVLSMEEQRKLLGKFGTTLVGMEHIHTLMRSYLNVCYTWGELYILLNYYSLNNAIKFEKHLDNDYSSCNITYIHSYLTTEQWCLISQRITNFGEKPCKQIMQKLCIQKLRAVLIFESSIHQDLFVSIIKDITNSLEDYYECLINDKFSVNNIIPKLDKCATLLLADYIFNDIHKLNDFKIIKNCEDSKLIINALLYTCLLRINKLFKMKRKHDRYVEFKSPKVLENFLDDNFLYDTKVKFTTICNDFDRKQIEDFKLNELKFKQVLEIIRSLPILHLSKNIQSMLFVYLSSLLLDLKSINVEDESLERNVENILVGLSSHGLVVLPALYELDILVNFIVNNTLKYKEIFLSILESVGKNEEYIKKFKQVVSLITKDLNRLEYMKCCILVLQYILKNKKNKLCSESKSLLESYKLKICDRIVKEIHENENYNSMEAFILVFKIYLAANDTEKIKLMEKHLQTYIHQGINSEVSQNTDIKGAILLYTSIFNYKSKFENIVNDEFITKVWNLSNKLKVDNEEEEIYSKLMISIFEHVSNEKFITLTDEVLQITVTALREDDVVESTRILKTWNSILCCSFNPTKTKTWQEAMQKYLLQVCHKCNDANIDDIFWEDLVKFEINLIQTTQIILTPSITDMLLYTISCLLKRQDFYKAFTSSVAIMESLLRHRKAIISDRLPSYLQQYRTLMAVLCKRSNSDLNLEEAEMQQVSSCAHQLEKLTNNFTVFDKHIASVAEFVIADILQQYETITLYPSVKLHLNNCLYCLLSMCDQHAITCLMRVLSTASTEIFKQLYETYKKYYKFTGKV